MAGGGGSLNPRALELAYRYLARRERTVSELRRHLLGREVDEASVTAAIEELVDQGMLDDARFARLFVEDKRELQQWGSERIRRALLARGIDRELIEAALWARPAAGAGGTGPGGTSGIGVDPDPNGDPSTELDGELDRALGLLRQRFPIPPQGRRDRERALGLLLRKGYETDLAVEALYAHARDAATR